jgi:hypothetical protein
MTQTLTNNPISAPAVRSAPDPWPLPVPSPAEAADLFAMYELQPDQFHFLQDDVGSPSGICGCLVGVLLIDAYGYYGRALAASDTHGSCSALELATGWDEAFVDGLNCGFTVGSITDMWERFVLNRVGDDVEFDRGAALGAATHQILRNRRMLP